MVRSRCVIRNCAEKERDVSDTTPKGGAEVGAFRQCFSHLRHDGPAGLVVLFVAVPLCLGIALASGAPLFSGLVAGMVGGLVVGILSGSPLGVSGPAAGLAVIVLNSIQELGSFQVFLSAVVLAGILQIIAGVARAGILAYFFPSAVIKGMLAGIGILIILKQIPHAVGHDTDPEGQMSFVQPDGETTLTSLRSMIGDLTPAAILVSSLALLILVLWDSVLAKRSRIFQLIQGPLVAVGFGIVFQICATRFFPDWALSTEHLVRVPVAESFSGFFHLFLSPDWSEIGSSAIWITAVTLAVVASLETLLCVEATDRMDPQHRITPTNRELVAQGVGNTVSGMLGGLPVTQVIVRSSANIQSGAKTKTSAILHGLLLFLCVMALPKVLNLIPLSVLASILLVVGYKLARPSLFKQMFQLGPSQFVPFATTILGIVFTDLLMGIGLGMGVAIFVILIRNYNNSHFMHMEEDDSSGSHVVRIRLSEEVSFLNRGAILRELNRIPDNSAVVLDARDCVLMNHDVHEIIEDFERSASRRNIALQILRQGEGMEKESRRMSTAS